MSFAFFLSGAAALIFEMVWFHRSGLVFGNSIWSTSIVLSSFMAGLCLGNGLAGRYAHRVARLLGVYAILEATVAVTGVALTYILPELPRLLVPVTRPVADSAWLVNLIRLVTAFAVMTLPATAMGATLPILVGASCRTGGRRFGSVLGRLYGWNTLGAVAGVVAAELTLIPRLGVAGSAWAAALANLGAASCALWISRRADEGLASPGREPLLPSLTERAPLRLLLCAFLAGGALMALEVVWFRFLSMFVINSTLAISMMLAVVLAAIGLGGLAASIWVGRRPGASAYVPAVAAGEASLVVASYVAFQFVTEGSQVAEWYRVLWFSCALTFASSFLSGMLFTLVGEAVGRGAGRDGVSGVSRTVSAGVGARAAGWLTLANTAGATCGPLVATFVLLPFLGIERAFFALAALYCAIAALAMADTLRSASRAAKRTLGVAALGALAALGLFPFGLMSSSYFIRAAQPYSADGSRIVQTREGATETIFLMEQSWLGRPIYHRLVTNGFSMSGTHLTGIRYMRSFVYLPMLLHQAPLKRALVVCYGLGITAGAVTDVESIESIDVVEVSRDVIAMSEVIDPPDRHPLRDRRVRLHVEDGRQFLRTSDQQFDMITGEPPPPLTPGTVNLYTREYFQLVHDRLAEGGITSYWLPVPRNGEYAIAPIIRAFCDVFSDCSLWNGTLFDWVLVGTRRAPGPVSEPQFSKAWADPVLGPHLREIGYEVPQQIGATFIRDASYLKALTEETPALTDDYPRRLRGSDDRALKQFNELIDTDRARQAFEGSELVRRLWPDALARATLPFFEPQRIINRVMLEGANPLRHIGELHALLTETSLRRLPLWAMGSNDVLQRVADSGNDGTGMVEYLLGERLLVARNYSAAATYFAESQRRGLRLASARALEVYALCLAGKLDAARERAPVSSPGDADERMFWSWLESRFGVGPAGER